MPVPLDVTGQAMYDIGAAMKADKDPFSFAKVNSGRRVTDA